MKQRSDEQLVTQILNGDRSSFEILVKRYQKQVFALAYRLGGDYDEAQDMAQEAFLRIFQELPRYDIERRFFPWMYKVAQNTCLNMINKKRYATTLLDDELQLCDNTSRDMLPDEAYAVIECSDAVTAALKELPESYRIPLVLKYLEGLSYQEISEYMHLPVTTIETRLFRGRAMLKKKLAAYIK